MLEYTISVYILLMFIKKRFRGKLQGYLWCFGHLATPTIRGSKASSSALSPTSSTWSSSWNFPLEFPAKIVPGFLVKLSPQTASLGVPTRQNRSPFGSLQEYIKRSDSTASPLLHPTFKPSRPSTHSVPALSRPREKTQHKPTSSRPTTERSSE